MEIEIEKIKKFENGLAVVKGDCIVFKLDYVHSNVAKERNENWAHILTKEWVRFLKDTVDKEIGFTTKKFYENCEYHMRTFLTSSTKDRNLDNPFMLFGLKKDLNIVIEIQNNKLIFEIWKK